MTARRMTADDIFPVYVLGTKMHARSRFKDWAIDPNVAFATFTAAASGTAGSAGWVEYNDAGQLLGFIVGSPRGTWFSSDKVFSESGFFMDLDLKTGFAARRLVKSFAQYAKETGCREALIGIRAGIDDDQTRRFLELIGFEMHGYSMTVRF